MALTKACSSITDWNALAQNTVEVTSVLDISDSYETTIHIQAFLDTETAHTGTEFIIQGSSATTGDEDWYDITRFVDLVAATNNEETIDDNPWATDDLTTAVTSTTGYTTGLADGVEQWIAVKDGTLANSELMLMSGAAANTTITVLDNKTNSHANTTNLYSTAISRGITIGIGHYRVRVVINNTYDINGSTLNYRVRAIKVTALS